MDEGNVSQTDSNRRRRAPVARPLIPPRSADHRDAVPHKCPMTNCISGVHGDYCDGSKPPWVVSVKVNLLNPGKIGLKQFRLGSCYTLSLLLSNLVTFFI